MAKYFERFELDHDIHDCIKASEDAIEELGWKLIKHDDNEFLMKNREFSYGKKYPVNIEMTLSSKNESSTKFSLNGDLDRMIPSFGPIIKNYVKEEMQILRTAIEKSLKNTDNNIENQKENDNEIDSKLLKIKDLYDKELISEEDYQKKKEEILKNI